MQELCEYELEDKYIPAWVSDGGYWPWNDKMIGVCIGAPNSIERITEWELKTRLVSMHNETNFLKDDDTVMTQTEVETESDNFFSDKVPVSTWDNVNTYRDKLMAAADKRIMRWDEQGEMAITKDDAGVAYTGFNTTGYTNKDALMWYKQDLRDITTNYGTVAAVVWPSLPA